MEPGNKIYGVDVSHWNPLLDYRQLAGMGRKFLFAKATEGVSYRDPSFRIHRAGAGVAGMIFGGYHFFRPFMDPLEQAKNFLEATQGVRAGELPLTLDIEWIDGLDKLEDHANGALVLLDKLEQETGMVPIVYTSEPFFQGFSNPERFLKYPCWLAAYSKAPKIPAPWSRYGFWQYTEKENIPGHGRIDGNIFNGTLEELKKMTRKA